MRARRLRIPPNAQRPTLRRLRASILDAPIWSASSPLVSLLADPDGANPKP